MRVVVTLAALVAVAELALVPAAAQQPAAARARAALAPEPADASPPRLLVDPGGFAGPVSSLAFRPGGAWLAAAGDDKAVRIWDLETGRLRHTLRGFEATGSLGATTAVAFSPSGDELLVGVRDYSPEGAIRVYRTADLSRIAALLPGHEQGGVLQLAYSADGKYLASLGADNRVIVWDWPARRPLTQATVQGSVLYLGFPKRLPILAAIDEQGPHAWSLVHGKDAFALSAAESAELGGAFDAKAFAAEFQRMAGWLARPPLGELGRKNQTRYDPESGLVLLGGVATRDGSQSYWAGVWSAAQGNLLQLYKQHRYVVSAVAIEPARGIVASADLLGDVHVWDARTGKERYTFRGQGRPVYRVAYSASGRELAFGTRSYDASRWSLNNYAELDQTFDIDKRRMLDGAPGPHRTEVTRQAQRELSWQHDAASDTASISCTRNGQLESRYTLPARVRPMCYSFLQSSGPGFADPIVVGRSDNVLTCTDPLTMLPRREFAGHQGAVTSVSESPDGRFLATGCTDGIIRLYSLAQFRDYPFPDFDAYADGIVNYVVPGGFSERAGIRTGDQFLGMDGRNTAALMALYVTGPWPYRVGQTVSVDMGRNGQRYRTNVAIVAGGDFAEPLLSLFMTAGGDWVMWTPQGYYDASLGGDRLIGWHVNQARAEAAKFYLVEQFRTQFYRPDIIDRVLETGDVASAVAQANAARNRPAQDLDPRRPAVVTSLEPPRVRILEPAEGLHTRSGRITVRAEVESQNELPVGDVTILVQGRPAGGAGSRPADAAADRKRTVVREVALLPGRNEIAVVAANQASTSRPATVSVSYDASPLEELKPNLYVLAVGISKYAHDDIRKLQFANRDAEEFAAAWKRQQGVRYEKVEARLIIDDKATSRNILDGIDWLTKSATQKDVAILFLAAHGVLDDRQNYYLAAHEIDLASLRSTAVRWSEIKALSQELPCQFLLFADTCHSGGVSGARGLQMFDEPLRDLSTEARGTIVFASCLPREVSWEDPKWGHGAFTKAVLDILSNPASDLNHDGWLSLAELGFQIPEHVKGLTEGKQHAAEDWPPTVQPDYHVYQFGHEGG